MNSNPSAFPLVTSDRVWDDGMTLRDWFAGQAMAGGLARASVPDYDLNAMFGPHRTSIKREEIVAADAYRIADAMLARRDISASVGQTPGANK